MASSDTDLDEAQLTGDDEAVYFDDDDAPDELDLQDYFRDLARAHLDALAHAALRYTAVEVDNAGGEEGLDDGPTAAEPYYEAAEHVESLAAEAGWLLPLQELAVRYQLGAVEVDALVWAFVQQSRSSDLGLPTLNEFLTVRFANTADRNAALSMFQRESRLRHWGLLNLMIPPDASSENLRARILSLPEPVTAFLLAERSLGDSLGNVATMVRVTPDETQVRGVGARRIELPQEGELRALITHYIDRITSGATPEGIAPRSLVVEYCAPPRAGATSTVRELARQFGALLIELDCTRLAVCPPQLQLQIVDEAAHVLRLYDAWLVIDRVEALENLTPAQEALARLTDRTPTLFFVLSRSTLHATHPLGSRAICHVEFQAAESTRQGLWRHALDTEHVELPPDEDLRMMAAKFDLGVGQIDNAARLVALRNMEEHTAPLFDMLDASALEQQRGNLSEVAVVRTGRGQLDDLVLPDSEKDGIREIIRAARFRTQLLHGWRFKERFNYGTGIVALFSGEPGTGKTYAAEVIAAALGLDLFQIAVPQVVSKWVGETEKQIARIFEEARGSRALLLFDEADSLLGSRTEVKTASDRYANMATNHLLQAIEAYEGVTLLTTNLEENLDSAAERRILFRIRFPFPGAEERAELWQRMLPRGAPLADDIDFEELGELFELSGGHIKNALIRAGYDALERGVSLDMMALTTAAEQEARMIGKLVRRGDAW